MQEKLIYVVLAQTVQPTPTTSVIQVCGRNMAQAAHVVSAMRVDLDRQNGSKGDVDPITTIVLAARDSKELLHLIHLLYLTKLKYYSFYDTNEEVYKIKTGVITAICTEPVEQARMVGILDYLPLWSHSLERK